MDSHLNDSGLTFIVPSRRKPNRRLDRPLVRCIGNCCSNNGSDGRKKRGYCQDDRHIGDHIRLEGCAKTTKLGGWPGFAGGDCGGIYRRESTSAARKISSSIRAVSHDL
jgi:hypothetical protein